MTAILRQSFARAASRSCVIGAFLLLHEWHWMAPITLATWSLIAFGHALQARSA